MDFRTTSLLSALVTELTFFYNSFLFFSYSQKDTLMWIDYIPWVLGVLLVLIFNKKFLQKQRTVLSISLTNGAFVFVWIILGFKYFFHASGFGAYTYAVLFLLVTSGRALYLAIHGISETNMLMHTEFSVMSAGFFFFTQIGPFQVPIEFNLPSIFMVALNIMALIRMRIYGTTSKSITASKWRGILFLLALTAFFAIIIAAVLLFLSTPFRTFFIKLIAVFKYIVVWFLQKLGALLRWLLSGFKYDGEIVIPMQEELQTLKEAEMELFNINPDILITALILIAVLAMIFLIIIFRKNKFKMTLRTHQVNRYQQKGSFKLLYFLSILLKRIYNNLMFAFTLLILRYNPGAAFIIIEKKGRKNGLPRQAHETPGMYLRRLSRSMTWDSTNDISIINSLLYDFIDEIEFCFYGNSCHSNNSCKLTKLQIRQLISAFSNGRAALKSK